MDDLTAAQRTEFAYLVGLVDLAFSESSTLESVWRLVPSVAFTRADHAELHRWIGECVTSGTPLTPQLLVAGGDRYDTVSGLLRSILSCPDMRTGLGMMAVDRHAAAVAAAYRRSVVVDAMSTLERMAGDPRATAEDLLTARDEVAVAIECVRAAEPPAPVTLVTAIEEWRNGCKTPVVKTTFKDFDELGGGGIPVGGITVLAAPPSVGKSALALQLAIGAVDDDRNLSVLWCLGEMTLSAFARRAICCYSTMLPGVHWVQMSHAGEDRTDLAQGAAFGMVAKSLASRLHILQPPLTIGSIEAAIVKSGARLVVVDYVQLVEFADAQDRRAEIDAVVKHMRRLCLERGLAIVLVSNISKAVGADTRIGAIGKESSELDYAADMLFLGTAEDVHDGKRRVRWSCKKNRHGECRDVITDFDGRYQKFTPASDVPEIADFSGSRSSMREEYDL
jgi:replicative DNA helicase